MWIRGKYLRNTTLANVVLWFKSPFHALEFYTAHKFSLLSYGEDRCFPTLSRQEILLRMIRTFRYAHIHIISF